MILLAAWGAMRFGELTELRRSDRDLKNGVIKIRRGVVWVKDSSGVRPVVGPPTSDAGVRDVNVPPHLMPCIREHLAAPPMARKGALLFPAAGTRPGRHRRSFAAGGVARRRGPACSMGTPTARDHQDGGLSGLLPGSS